MKKGYLILGCLLFISTVYVVLHIKDPNSKAPGKFLDHLDLRDLGDGRQFELLKEFKYLDPKDVVWVVPKGAKTNGASIPKFFWRIIGPPWTGTYRRAAVVHDYFFTRDKYSSKSIHRVFYDAMLTDRVPPNKALVMYWAVLRFNDRWEQVEIDPYQCMKRRAKDRRVQCYPAPPGTPLVRRRINKVSVSFAQKELDDLKKLIKEKNFSPEDIERLAEQAYQKADKKYKNVETIKY